ncbi:hypothetical protein [Nostoc sp.]
MKMKVDIQSKLRAFDIISDRQSKTYQSATVERICYPSRPI